MEKCLITTLNAEYDQDTPYLKGARFVYDGSSSVLIKTRDSEDTYGIQNMAPTGSRVIGIDNCIFKHPQDPTPVYENDFITTENQRVNVFKADSGRPARFAIIYPNYDIVVSMGFLSDYRNFHIATQDEVEVFKHLNNLTTLNFGLVNNMNIDAFLDDLDADITQIRTFAIGPNKLTFSRLFDFYNISRLNFADYQGAGSIETLVDGFRQAQSEAGVATEGSIGDVTIANTPIKFENKFINTGHYTLSWDANSLTFAPLVS